MGQFSVGVNTRVQADRGEFVAFIHCRRWRRLNSALDLMGRHVRLPAFWLLATAQVVLVVSIASLWFYFRTSAYLAGPPDPDTYAWSWGFQWFVFAVYWLPGVLLLSGLLLAIERAALARFYRAASSSSIQQRGHEV